MRSGQSSRGDRQCENSLEILHSHPTRLVHPSTTPPGEVRCLPPTTTCPLVCEATNPIRPLYTALPIHYSTLISTPHHSSFATCSLPSFYLKTSRHPSAQPTRTLGRNFIPSKPSTQLVDTPKHPSRSHQQSFALLHLPPRRFYFLHHPPRATTHLFARARVLHFRCMHLAVGAS